MPPVQPMLAKSVKGIPDPAKTVDGRGLSFEPKWDGFRCLVFKDGDEVELASRNTKPLTRYFPEVVDAIREQLPERCVLDGEIFVALHGDDGVDRLEFETLQERIHPAKSPDRHARGEDAGRLRRLRPAGARRHVVRRPAVRRAPGRAREGTVRADRSVLPHPDDDRPGGGRGVVPPVRGRRARRRGRQAAGRAVRRRTPAPCSRSSTSAPPTSSSPGYREHKTSTPERPLLGSLLLGLYDGDQLQHIGVSASFTEARRAELIEELQPLVVPHRRASLGALGGVPHRQPRPGARHPEPLERRARTSSFTPLRPERVLEVAYDHMEGRRFRHTAQFRRWRTDRDPESRAATTSSTSRSRYDLQTSSASLRA